MSSGDMGIHALWQNYRYTKKAQISLDLKKYRYVGVITGFGNTEKIVIKSRIINGKNKR
jgi:hypothetical protein